jgi:catechol 2,3-dioxygenase-like lactoylglutathione lyase family enzyme
VSVTPAAIRLHHNAFVVRDQRVTRHFYEDLIGLPLAATWTEVDELFGKQRTYCHTFYALDDGGALAFFQFADEDDQREFEPQFRPSPFVHIALKTTADSQAAIESRLAAADYAHFTLEHGYCTSLYATDPDGLIVEFTVDHPDVEQITAERRQTAADDLERWLGGDHSSNNTYRPGGRDVPLDR